MHFLRKSPSLNSRGNTYTSAAKESLLKGMPFAEQGIHTRIVCQCARPTPVFSSIIRGHMDEEGDGHLSDSFSPSPIVT